MVCTGWFDLEVRYMYHSQESRNPKASSDDCMISLTIQYALSVNTMTN